MVKKDQKWEWRERHEKAFKELKGNLPRSQY